MSVSHCTYLGPFFACKTHKENKTVLRWGCHHGKGISHLETTTYLSKPSHEFCPKCGTRIGKVSIKVASPAPDQGDVADLLGEDVMYQVTSQDANWPDDCHYWIPNQRRDGRPDVHSIDLEYGGSSIAAIKSMDAVIREIAWFAEAYTAEHAILLEAYGSENVTIEWGIIKYWM